MQSSFEKSQVVAVPVWDLPVRVFHWLLVALVITAFVTVEVLDDAMEWHVYAGYGVLVLLVFRVLWGIVGSPHARFWDFIYGIPSVVRYGLGLLRGSEVHYVGHNPLGGWSVIFLLTFLFIQVGTGLFADDDIMTQGPLARWLSGDMREAVTAFHEFNFNILLGFIGLHLAAVIFYRVVKGENLVKPMITGYKWLPRAVAAQEKPLASLVRAVVVLLIAGGLVYGLVVLGGR